MRKHLPTILKVFVTIAGLAFVLSQIEIEELGETLFRADVGWLLLTFALIMSSLVIRAFRWFVLLRGLGLEIGLGRLSALYFVGNFFNAFLPTSFGGDVMRIVEVTRDVPGEIAAGTVIVDRLTGLLMLFLMALLALPFRPEDFPQDLLIFIATVSFVGLVGGIILLEGSLIRRFGGWLPGKLSPVGDGPLARVLQAVTAVGWRALLEAFGVSLFFNLVLVTWWYTAGLALRFNVNYAHYLLVVPILSLSLLVPSIGGLGPREAVAPTLFATQLANGEAVALSLLVFFLQRLSGLPGGPIYLWMTLRGTRPQEGLEAISESRAE